MAEKDDERQLWQGKFLEIVRRGRWEFVRRRGTTGVVGIVAVTDAGRLLLVEQYRPPVGRNAIELPAGLAGDVAGAEHEPLAEAARRELLEETGYDAREVTYLTEGVSSAGMTDETVTLFRASGLVKRRDAVGDASEQITLHEVPVGEVESWLRERVRGGAVVDLKIYAALRFVGAAS
jgi:ADP-ribose pyrophosphatase